MKKCNKIIIMLIVLNIILLFYLTIKNKKIDKEINSLNAVVYYINENGVE